MHFPQYIYLWIVENKIINNDGELDAHGQVHLPNHQSNHFINGFLVAELIKTILSKDSSKVPPSLITIKSDNSKSTKLTNWNFIWLALPQVGLQLDLRLKQLILQGEHTLIVQLIRQLHDNDHSNNSRSLLAGSSITIKSRPDLKSKANTFDVKKINFAKDPDQSQSTLQFLILLLKSSLGMKLEEILGLFTNQNKYLAHIIVKGLNDSFEPIILFYALLNKHANKLKHFLMVNRTDAEASLHAIKPGFTSKNFRVSQLTLQLFQKLDGLYEWFINQESKCLSTFFLGLRRHSDLQDRFWKLLMKITKENEIQFFTTYYSNGFENSQELIDISSYMLRHISKSKLKDDLVKVGVIAVWLDTAIMLPQHKIEPQITVFNFIGQLLLYLPQCIEEQCFHVLARDWLKRSMPNYVTLANELMYILEKLAKHKSPMAKQVYSVLCNLVEEVGSGDKRDYLVECFMPLISLFPTIPSQQFVENIKGSTLSPSELLLICQSIQYNSSIHTLAQVGNSLKKIFIQNPLVNSYIPPLLTQIVQKIFGHSEGLTFFSNLVEQSLYGYAVTFLKYRPKNMQNNHNYFGKKGNSQAINKEEVIEMKIGQCWKDIYLGLAQHLLKMVDKKAEAKEVIKQKLIKVNNYIKFHNFKNPSKQLSKILWDHFQFKMEDKPQPPEPKNTTSEVDFIEKIQAVTTQERRVKQAREKAIKQKKYLDFKRKRVNKQLYNSNLVRGQVAEAQIHEDGFLQLVVHQPQDIQLVHFDELEQRDLQSIDCLLKRYQRVLRHLFYLYTGTKNHNHNIMPQLIEDIQKRKETLTGVELIQLLKDYGKFYLTSHSEVSTMVRDINIRLLNKRNIQELDFQGFEMFIVQFCYHNMIIPHQITTNTIVNNPLSHKSHQNAHKVQKNLKGEPIGVILKQFFQQLKGTFISKGQRIQIFDDVEDTPMTSQQAQQVARLNGELELNPQFILPAGYKKITETSMENKYELNFANIDVPFSYQAALQALDYIFSKSPLNMHIIEGITKQQIKHKAKATALISPEKLHRQRAMSTLIPKNKQPFLFSNNSPVKGKSTLVSKQLAASLKQMAPKQRVIGEQVALIIEEMINKIAGPIKPQSSRAPSEKKEPVKPKRRAVSSFKIEKNQQQIQVINKMRQQKQAIKKKQKEKEKQQERKRRQHVAKFLEEQKQKILQKKQKQQQQKERKAKEQQEKIEQKKANMEKFKSFHKSQVEKIKKIEFDALQKKKIEQDVKLRQRQKDESFHRHLKQKIEDSDRHRIEVRRQVEQKFSELLSSQSIKEVFQHYEPNLQALFNFLINHTHNSLTQKKHNNEVIYDTWRYFFHAFELSPIIVDPKDLVQLFKSLTKHKVISKQYMIGLSFNEFEEALMRIAVKYKGVFNVVGDKIFQIKLDRSNIRNEEVNQFEVQQKVPNNKMDKSKSSANQGGDFNEFQPQVNVKDLIRQNNEGKDELNQYGDISKVTDKTLKGLIHYLKVPRDRGGQEKRFKEILSQKIPIYVSNAERLKQKLSEDFSMPESPKRRKKLQDSKVEEAEVPEAQAEK